MKKYCLLLMVFITQAAVAQKIINAVMVSEKGITEDYNKAKYLIVIKTYGDTAFERLEYNFTGPMKRLLTYKDSLLQVLNGPYTVFSSSGTISTEGNYVNNKKEGSWHYFNSSSKAVKEYKYHMDTLLAVMDVDSLEKTKKKIIEDTTDEHEAEYKGGMKRYTEYINQNLKIPERTLSIGKGGTVKVRFIVNKNGEVTNVRIFKSVELAFDEEAMRVVSSAKDWIPAVQKGRKVNAYREQPITITIN